MEFTPFVLGLIAGAAIGLVVGSTATWAIKVGQELKALRAKEAARLAADEAKIKLAAQTDVERARVTVQEVGNFFRGIKADFAAEVAKIKGQADSNVASAQSALQPAAAPVAPAAVPDPAAAPATV